MRMGEFRLKCQMVTRVLQKNRNNRMYVWGEEETDRQEDRETDFNLIP